MTISGWVGASEYRLVMRLRICFGLFGWFGTSTKKWKGNYIQNDPEDGFSSSSPRSSQGQALRKQASTHPLDSRFRGNDDRVGASNMSFSLFRL